MPVQNVSKVSTHNSTTSHESNVLLYMVVPFAIVDYPIVYHVLYHIMYHVVYPIVYSAVT